MACRVWNSLGQHKKEYIEQTACDLIRDEERTTLMFLQNDLIEVAVVAGVGAIVSRLLILNLDPIVSFQIESTLFERDTLGNLTSFVKIAEWSLIINRTTFDRCIERSFVQSSYVLRVPTTVFEDHIKNGNCTWLWRVFGSHFNLFWVRY